MARAAAKKTRTRRSPEAARDLILDAATRVFATRTPDAVGLREIAAEAKISHGLVTHYFATYDNLVHTVLERSVEAARAKALSNLGARFNPAEQPLLTALIDLLDDKALVRLIAWSAMRGDVVFGKHGQLRGIVDVMLAMITAAGGKPDRERIELTVVFALSTVMGWGVIGESVATSVGTAVDRNRLRTELQRMLFAYAAAP